MSTKDTSARYESLKAKHAELNQLVERLQQSPGDLNWKEISTAKKEKLAVKDAISQLEKYKSELEAKKNSIN